MDLPTLFVSEGRDAEKVRGIGAFGMLVALPAFCNCPSVNVWLPLVAYTLALMLVCTLARMLARDHCAFYRLCNCRSRRRDGLRKRRQRLLILIDLKWSASQSVWGLGLGFGIPVVAT